jgi:hypothetical protein
MRIRSWPRAAAKDLGVVVGKSELVLVMWPQAQECGGTPDLLQELYRKSVQKLVNIVADADDAPDMQQQQQQQQPRRIQQGRCIYKTPQRIPPPAMSDNSFVSIVG